MPRIAAVVQRHLALYLYRKLAVEKTQLLYFTAFILAAENLLSTKKIYTDHVCLSFCFWHLFFSPQKTLAVKKNFYCYMVLRQV
jgi:hypothetical protein